jgi:hypothetical protein
MNTNPTPGTQPDLFGMAETSRLPGTDLRKRGNKRKRMDQELRGFFLELL